MTFERHLFSFDGGRILAWNIIDSVDANSITNELASQFLNELRSVYNTGVDFECTMAHVVRLCKEYTNKYREFKIENQPEGNCRTIKKGSYIQLLIDASDSINRNAAILRSMTFPIPVDSLNPREADNFLALVEDDLPLEVVFPDSFRSTFPVPFRRDISPYIWYTNLTDDQVIVVNRPTAANKICDILGLIHFYEEGTGTPVFSLTLPYDVSSKAPSIRPSFVEAAGGSRFDAAPDQPGHWGRTFNLRRLDKSTPKEEVPGANERVVRSIPYSEFHLKGVGFGIAVRPLGQVQNATRRMSTDDKRFVEMIAQGRTEDDGVLRLSSLR